MIVHHYKCEAGHDLGWQVESAYYLGAPIMPRHCWWMVVDDNEDNWPYPCGAEIVHTVVNL